MRIATLEVAADGTMQPALLTTVESDSHHLDGRQGSVKSISSNIPQLFCVFTRVLWFVRLSD